MESLEPGALIRHCVQTLSAGAPPARRIDLRVTKVLREIQQSNDLRVSLKSAAAAAFLSPSRFAHLFKQQLGLPFRPEGIMFTRSTALLGGVAARW